MKTSNVKKRFIYKFLILILGISITLIANDQIKIYPDFDIEYKDTKQGKLFLHIFTPTDYEKREGIPAIVLFHGGGWETGHAKQFYRMCETFSKKGYLCVSSDYRIKNIHNTTPVESVEDAKSTIRFIRKNATRFHINPNMIIAGGGSAGGHIAAATGTLLKYDNPNEDLNISSKPNALILLNPVFDNSPKGYGYNRVKEYWKDISPLHNISKDTPPTIILSGDKDKLVPIDTVLRYKNIMDQYGIQCNLHIYPNQKHGFFNKNKNFKKVIPVIEQFIKDVSLD